MPDRLLLEKLIAERGETYADVSKLLGRNAAYIQQYLKRGVPRQLTAKEQDRLARHFDMPPNFLKMPHAYLSAGAPDTPDHLREKAASHLRIALALCDDLGADMPACHVQHALDLLNGWTPEGRADSPMMQ